METRECDWKRNYIFGEGFVGNFRLSSSGAELGSRADYKIFESKHILC